MLLKKEMSKIKNTESKLLLDSIIESIKEYKGNSITILDFKDIETSVCKYFVICCGNSKVHINSISEGIKRYVSKKVQENPWSIEGKSESEWVLMDYSDIVVHIFQERIREFYNLEDLWGDAHKTEINN